MGREPIVQGGWMLKRIQKPREIVAKDVLVSQGQRDANASRSIGGTEVTESCLDCLIAYRDRGSRKVTPWLPAHPCPKLAIPTVTRLCSGRQCSMHNLRPKREARTQPRRAEP